MERIASTIVSIPLEQGNVFRLNLRVSRRVIEVVSQSLWNRAMSFDQETESKSTDQVKVSIPLEQGNVFRPGSYDELKTRNYVSIPLEQGNVFRLQWGVRALCGKASQSHFPTFSDA
jgi:hypothetical protein